MNRGCTARRPGLGKGAYFTDEILEEAGTTGGRRFVGQKLLKCD